MLHARISRLVATSGTALLAFIAEDLGLVTAEVHALRERFDLPGMRVLQFAFSDSVIDLSDRVDDSSSSVVAPFYVNGGKQVGYQLGAIWNPTDFIRFMAQYSHIDVTGGPRGSVATASTPGVFPIGTLTPANRRKYGVDTWGARAQVDF